MNINTLSAPVADHKSGSLPIALYPNAMRREADGRQTFFARPVCRKRLSMEDIATDMIVAGVNNDLSTEQIVAIWNSINNAILDRVSNGCSVDGGLGIYSPKITGRFETENDTFSPQRHSIDMAFRTGNNAKSHLAKLDVVIRQGNSAKPHISDIHDLESGGSELLTRGGFLEIMGSNLAIEGTDDSVGLYFMNVDDEKKSVRLEKSKIGTNSSTRLACVVPATLADGTYRIKVVTQFTKSKATRKEPLSFVFDKRLNTGNATA